MDTQNFVIPRLRSHRLLQQQSRQTYDEIRIFMKIIRIISLILSFYYICSLPICILTENGYKHLSPASHFKKGSSSSSGITWQSPPSQEMLDQLRKLIQIKFGLGVTDLQLTVLLGLAEKVNSNAVIQIFNPLTLKAGQAIKIARFVKQFKAFAKIRQQIEAGERPRPVDLFVALREGIDRKRIDRESRRQGQVLKGSEKELDVVNYGFTLSEDEVEKIFKVLDLKPGEQVLEIGPGYTVLCVIAALLGTKVTVVEPSQKRRIRLKAIKNQVEDLIQKVGGELIIIEKSILDSEVQSELKDGSFDHIWALHVFNSPEAFEMYRELAQLHRHDGLSLELGIVNEAEALRLAETIARVKKPFGGCVYISIVPRTPEENIVTEALQRQGLKIDSGIEVATPTSNKSSESSSYGSIYKILKNPSLEHLHPSPLSESL